MNNEAKIRDNFNRLKGAPALRIGTVTSVDRDNQCCTVQCIDTEDVYYKIRLNASMDSREGIVIVPTQGSEVIFLPFKGNSGGVIIAFGEVDEIKLCNNSGTVQILDDGVKLTTSKSELYLNEDKIAFKNEEVSLKDVLTDIKDIITNLKVLTGVGPSAGLVPDSVTALTTLNTNISKLLS